MMEDFLKISVIEECIQKQNSSRKNIEKLLLKLIDIPDNKEAEKALFDEIHSFDAMFGELPVEKEENVYYPRNSFWMNETIWKNNADNIRKVIRLIQEFQNDIKNPKGELKGEDNLWKAEYIYNPTFLEIARIPIYLPSIFIDPISGEYLLYLIYGKNKNYTFNRLLNRPECEKNYTSEDYITTYQRLLGSNNKNKKYSIVKQIETSIGLKLGNMKDAGAREQHNDRKPLFTVLNMLSYASYYHEAVQINFSSSRKEQPLKDLKNPTLDLFKITRTNDLSSKQERLVVLKTLLFQSLSDNDKSQVYYDTLLARCFIGIKLLGFYLQKSLPDKCSNKIKGESIKEKSMNAESNSAEEKTETCDLYKNPTTVSNLCKNVLYGILSTEHEMYSSTIKNYHRHIDSIYKIDDEQRKLYLSYNPQERIGISTFDEFEMKYGNTTCLFSRYDKTELRKAWNMTLMIWFALSPERFGITEDVIKDMPPITKSFRPWIEKRGICIESLSYEEVVPMMLIALKKMSSSDKGSKLATAFGFQAKKISVEGRCNILSWYKDQCLYLRGLMSYEEIERFSQMWDSLM